MKEKKERRPPQRVRFYNMAMDDELYERIREAAFKEDLSMNKFLKKATREYLKKLENEQ